MKVPSFLNKFVYLIFGIFLSLFLLLVGNMVTFNHQEDVKRNTFAISSCDESFEMCSQAWAAVNKIKSNTKDTETINQCDKALEYIGQSKDIILRTKMTLGHK